MPSLSLGLPEVLLGIHPGFGGTVRSGAAHRCAPGARSHAQRQALQGRARAGGGADRRTRAAGGAARARQGAAAGERRRDDRAVRRQALELERRCARSSPSRPSRPCGTACGAISTRRPTPVVDLWQRHGAAGTESYEAEARSISELMCTPTSRNLVRVFLLQDRLKGLGGKSPAEFRHVHVDRRRRHGRRHRRLVGVSRHDGHLAGSQRRIDSTGHGPRQGVLRQAAQRAAGRCRRLARLRMDVQGRRRGGCRRRHRSHFRERRGQARAVCRTRAQAQSRPPFSPPIPRASRSRRWRRSCATPAVWSASTSSIRWRSCSWWRSCRERAPSRRWCRSALRFTRKLDKLPLPCKSAPGFVVNRILTPYVNEALFALESGIPAAVIDRAGKDFGMPMGPIELTDVVGLDVSLHVGRVLARRVPAAGSRDLDQAGGAEETRPQERRGILRVAGRQAGEAPRRRKTPYPADLEDRLILPMLNEAVACLREGVIEDADLLDAGAIFATGFAPFRGGPLQYAKARGVANVTARLDELAQRYGERFRPDPGWRQFRLRALL